jgi:hypothetical protein
MEAYPRAAMERAMKVQDVMLQAMAKKITWWQAAQILGISDRLMRRWRERYVEEGSGASFSDLRRRRCYGHFDVQLSSPRRAYFAQRRERVGHPDWARHLYARRSGILASHSPKVFPQAATPHNTLILPEILQFLMDATFFKD